MSRFVVQLHDATTLHFDLRIQIGEVLRSCAVPKGPSLDPHIRRLAMAVEDHSLAAGDYEGVRAGQERGTGAVIIWDEGDAEVIRDEPGHLSVLLRGSKLAGGFALTRTGERRWILVKTRDDRARPGSDIVAEQPRSVRSGRTWEDLAHEHAPVLSYRIRRATAGDVGFLADVVIEATRAQGRLPDGFAERQWRASFTERTTEQVCDGSPEMVTSVIEVGNERAGRLRINRTAGGIELCGIQLLPEFQRHGIGTAIIEDLKAQAATVGIPVDLGVEKDNPDARRLYERLGFVQVGETAQEYKLQWKLTSQTQ
jgi:DNA ligase D-like protein (predicted 3'-phosphoesterase)